MKWQQMKLWQIGNVRKNRWLASPKRIMLTAEQNDEATTRKAAQAVETKATTCKCSISKQFKQYKLTKEYWYKAIIQVLFIRKELWM